MIKYDMKNFDTFSLPGANCNEDASFICDDFLFVIDGATGLLKENVTPERSDARWFALRWCEYLKENLPNKSISIKEIVRKGITQIDAEYMAFDGAKHVQSKPSAGVAICRRENNHFNTFILGDCSIMLVKDKGFSHLFDTKLSKLDTEQIANMTAIAKSKGINVIDARPFISENLLANRKLLNTPQGYWVLASDPKAADNAQTNKISLSDIKKVVAMTDGFSQIFDTLAIMSKEEFAQKVLRGVPAEDFVKLIRQTQDEDFNCNRFPRFKKSDDTTVIIEHLDRIKLQETNINKA